MSKRKRYRRLRNKAVKSNMAAFSANRRKNREEREASDSKEQLGRARLLYESFKTELCSEGRSAPQVIAAFEAFKDIARKIVKHKHSQQAMLTELNYNLLKFLAAYGPKGEAQIEQWRAEAKALRVSNRRSLPPADDADGGSDLARN